MGAEMLLERERELAALREAIDAARTGRGSVVIVEGPAGLGKSALLRAAAGLAREGSGGRADGSAEGAADGAAAAPAGEPATGAAFRVLTGRGAPLEQGVAFGVARQLLAPYGGGALLDRAGARGAIPPDATLGLLQALHDLVVGLAWPAPGRATPVLLTVDDAQWTDRSSLRFLAHLARRVEELPLLLVLAIRSGEPDTPDDLLDHLRDGARLVQPAPLSEDAVGLLVRDQLGDAADAALCRACARSSGGNPFYLRELLLAIQAEGAARPSPEVVGQVAPESVLRSVLVRLARLGHAATGLATAVAVLGDGATLELASALADLDALAAERAADALAAADLLAPGEPLRFTHPLIAATLRAEMGAFERARAHRRAAELLADRGTAAELIAPHLLHARPEGDPGVLAPLRAAAALARERGQPEEAVRLLERALAEPPPDELRAEVLVELAAAGAIVGSPDAVGQLEQALELIDDPRRRAETLLVLSTQLHHAGDFARAAEMARRAAAELDPDDPLQLRLLAARIGSSFVHAGLRGEAETELRTLLEAARAGEYPSDPGLLALMALRMAEAGEPVERVRAVADAALAAGPLLDHDSQGTSVGFLATALIWVDELELAERWLDLVLAAATRANAALPRWIAQHYRAVVHLLRGRLAYAIADADSALELYRYGWAASPGSTTTLARAHLERGDLDAAREAIAIGEQTDPQRVEQVLVLEARARLRLATDDAAGALADAQAAGRHAEAFGSTSPRASEWRTLAVRAAHRLGDTGEARRLAEQLLELTRDEDVARVRGTVLHAAGVAAGDDGGLGLLTEAVHVLEASPARLERAHARAELGAALRRAGRRTAAKDALERALELADEIEAAPLVERLRGELHALGLRPRRAARSGPAALTPSERRVTELAAAGLSTPQIAHHLTVTKKTVESHLARVYRKLDIHSRAELPGALAGER